MTTRFLCGGHYDPKKVDPKAGVWMKNTSGDVIKGKTMHCDHPGCHASLSHSSPAHHYMYVFYKNGNRHGDYGVRVTQTSATHPGFMGVCQPQNLNPGVRKHKLHS